MHRKIDLQDAEVKKKNNRKILRNYAMNIRTFFSIDSSDIGKTPLIEMEIDTGEIPPITQKTLYSSFKTCYLGTERVREILEKAEVIVRSVSPWASPTVVVPKRTAPGEPPKRRLCIDYRAVNSLLPPVKKAFSYSKRSIDSGPFTKN